MLNSLNLENFRSFKKFQLSPLSKINLIVGENNSGKSSILEAIELLYSENNIGSILELLDRRSEFSWVEETDIGIRMSPRERGKLMTKEFDICHLFYNHNIDIQSFFSIKGVINNKSESINISIRSHDLVENNDEDEFDEFEDMNIKYLGNFDLVWDWNKSEKILPLTIDNNIRPSLIRNQIRLSSKLGKKRRFVTPFEYDVEQLMEIFDDIELTPKENMLIDALKVIEPTIERIASNKKSSDSGEKKGGFKILLSDREDPIPIGSMGDGIWRMLTLALTMIDAQHGVILIDDIDSGLHFTALLKMWEFIWKIANILNIQVFATTHNSDCWTSLAQLIAQDILNNGNGENHENQVTIHRIEQGKIKSIFFNEEEILIAQNRNIEVR